MKNELLPIYVDLNKIDSVVDKIEKVIDNPGTDIDQVGEWMSDVWNNTLLYALTSTPTYLHKDVINWFNDKSILFIKKLYA